MSNNKQKDSKTNKPVLEDVQIDIQSDEEFIPSEGLTSSEVKVLQAQWGPNALEEKVTPKWLIFLQQLWGPMPILIWIAIIIEAGIQNFLDMGVLLFIQFANAIIGWYETTKAGDAVAALKASLKPQATVKRDGVWETVNATTLVPGDMVLLASGSAVPADCKINKGILSVDQSALTGESLPITARDHDDVLMGSTVTRGEVEGTVMTTGMHTFFGKTASMLNQEDDLGNLAKILLRITLVLTFLSLLLCSISLAYLLIKKESFVEAISFAVVVLVASIPVAIEIVSTSTLALGSRQLSEKGAIVARLTSIEEMAGMNMLCSDKTGTLTLNKMVIQEDTPVYCEGYDQAKILQMAALAAKWKEPARDALDTLVLNAADLDALDQYEQIDFLPFDPAIKRTEGTLRGPDGKEFKTSKGAPQIILDLAYNKDEIAEEVKAKIDELGGRGIRSLAVAKFENDRWEMLGLLTFLDPPRPDTKDTIEKAMELGVDVKMITGDQKIIAIETSRMLGLGTHVETTTNLPALNEDGTVPKEIPDDVAQHIIEADGFAEVFPEHKFMIVEILKRQGFSCGMTGDGVNDAPALKKANVGIAVSGATDAARAAADIVLTNEGLSVVVDAIYVSRRIFQRVKSFINYRVAATLQLLVFFFIAVLALHPNKFNDKYDEDFFKMPVIMLMLITVLNDGTLISIGYDNVRPSSRPEKWNLKVLFIISIVLGSIACASSLLLLYLCLDSGSDGSIFQKMGLPEMPYGKIIAVMYLKVSVSDFLTLFSARTVGFFFSQKPAAVLLIAASCSLILSTIVACVWPSGESDGVPVEGLARGDYKLMAVWVWLYCLVWWAIQDTAKVVAYKLIFKFDVFGARSGAFVNVRETNDVTDATPAARASIALVEQKLLEQKIDAARKAVLLEQEKGGDNTKYDELLKQLDHTKEDYKQQFADARADDEPTARASVSRMAKRRNSKPLTSDVEQGGNAIDGLNNAVDKENMSHGIVTKIEGVTQQANKAEDTLVGAANVEN
eukprot:Awhi_evm1s839